MKIIQSETIGKLIGILAASGYRVVGPTVRDGAIIYDDINKVSDLPCGYTEEQLQGSYKIKKRSDDAYFGYAVGPHAWKKFLFPAEQRLWRARRSGKDFSVIPEEPDKTPFVFLGVRPCDLKAMAIQKQVFVDGEFSDPGYKNYFENAFVIVVQCGVPSANCFCTSMGTGPIAESEFDLSLTEIVGDSEHYFVIESGSSRGNEILKELDTEPATDKAVAAANEVVSRATDNISKQLDTVNLKEILARNANNPHWQDVAERCESCANCTMVCPTCFCTTVEDVTDLSGDHAERWRRWDSCFTSDFSLIHGGSTRHSVSARYRHWITHKLSTWHEQFGSSGCVGCGRCITWCPVGIDITEEATAIRASDVGNENT